MSDLFVEITDDLSYARTFYPRRSVRVYLNNLAQSVFNSLYKLKKDPFGNFMRFWKVSLPIEMYRARKHLLASFLIFTIALLIGVVSTLDDMDFFRIVTSDIYVDRTDGFIEQGDPMAIYKQESEFPFFVKLFLNNIQVSFLVFGVGILFCIGTGFLLIYNAIPIGAFHTYFHLKGAAIGASLLTTSLLTVWIHGTFEILAIILSGAAGFVAGMSLLLPGTFTRMQSFQIGIKRGLKMMMGVTPFIFFAAILEGYVTRHTEMPVWAKFTIIITSFLIFLFYFVIYPVIVYRKHEKEVNAPPEPVYRNERKVELYKLKQVNEIIADSFLILRELYGKIAKFIWTVSIPIHILVVYFIFQSGSSVLNFHDLNPFILLGQLISGDDDWLIYAFTALFFSMSVAVCFIVLKNHELMPVTLSRWKKIGNYFKTVFIFLPFMAIGMSIYYIEFELLFLLMLVALPLVIYIPVAALNSPSRGISAYQNAVSTFFANVGNSFSLFLIAILILGGFFLLINSTVYFILETLIEWHTITRIADFSLFMNFIHASIYIIFFHHFFVFLTLLFGLYDYVNIESAQSVSLFKKLKNFGTSSKTHEKFSANEE